MALMETFYLSHGAPTLAIDETVPARKFFQSWKQSVYREKPSSILVISAHWETAQPTVNVVDRNDTIYDFYGFPKPLYQVLLINSFFPSFLLLDFCEVLLSGVI